jgi:hypothetical protein
MKNEEMQFGFKFMLKYESNTLERNSAYNLIIFLLTQIISKFI